ncbi:MAG: biotin synthase BioB [Deltaproteobacteria bacterium]|nr:biotin synthase BioB [Deltaproteobacteria bacterium]
MNLSLEAVDPQGISPETALEILKASPEEIYSLFPLTSQLREKYFGKKVKLCSIVNAKSGHCSESCGFCPQSAHFKETNVETYPLMDADKIAHVAEDSWKNGSNEFSIVTSGYGMEDGEELAVIEEALQQITAKTELDPCASLGIVSIETLRRLKEAGLVNYHHNIETARSFHGEIVKTHSFEEELQVIRNAKEVGLNVCAGGIFGMGETLEQRVEFVFEVKKIDPASFPINFLNPRPGTPLENCKELTPLDCLKIIAISRLAMPAKDIFVLGGREVNLRELQSLIFLAGANGTMVGNYLTTAGRAPDETVRMIHDLGLEIVAAHHVPNPS